MKHGNCTAIVLGTGIITIAVNNFLAINDNFWKNRHNVATSADSNALLVYKCSDLKLHSSARVSNGKSRARSCSVIVQLHALTRSGLPH